MYSTKHGAASYRKKVYFSDKITENSNKKSGQRPADYCKTLVDPWSDLSVRIPDLACYPTAAFKQELNYVWNVSAVATNGNNQMLVIDLAETLGLFHCQGYQATAGVYTAGALNVTKIGPSNLSQYYDQFRVVSAGVKVQFADADTNTKGIIWGATFPTSSEGIQLNSNYQSSPWLECKAGNPCDLSTQALINNAKGVYSGPITDGVCLRYQPASATSFQMIRGIDTPSASQYFNFGRMVVIVDGLSTNDTRTLHCSIVVNIEAIPLTGNPSQIATSPSPVDGNALDAGLNAAGQMSPAFAASPGDIASNVTSVIRYLNKL